MPFRRQVSHAEGNRPHHQKTQRVRFSFMPTREHHGYELQVYTNDPAPPHVHVFTPSGAEVRVFLLDDGTAEYWDHVPPNLKRVEVRRALVAAEALAGELVEIWKENHGKSGDR